MRRSGRRLAIAALLLALAVVAGWAGWVLDEGNAVQRVVGIASVALTTWLVFEVHEDRLTRDRPFVFVDFLPRTACQGSPGVALRLRNEGRSPAVGIHINPTIPLLDQSGANVLQNPVLRAGVPFLGPGQAMTIDLHEDTVLDQLYEQAPTYRPGETPPPDQPLRATCRADYRDGITGRDYSETFTVDLDARHLGWTISTLSA